MCFTREPCAHHFAHLPGAVCTAPQTELETEEHRAGKLLIAQWLRICLPAAEIILEAHIPETNQRADVLVVLASPPSGLKDVSHLGLPNNAASSATNYQPSATSHLPPITREQRIAIEYQCANMTARNGGDGISFTAV